jgi:hypothetical protein
MILRPSILYFSNQISSEKYLGEPDILSNLRRGRGYVGNSRHMTFVRNRLNSEDELLSKKGAY